MMDKLLKFMGYTHAEAFAALAIVFFVLCVVSAITGEVWFIKETRQSVKETTELNEILKMEVQRRDAQVCIATVQELGQTNKNLSHQIFDVCNRYLHEK